MKKSDLIQLISFLLCILIAFIWTYGLICPGLILIDSIVNSTIHSAIYRGIYLATMIAVGVYLILILIVKGLIVKRVEKYFL